MFKVQISEEPWNGYGILFIEERNGKNYVAKPVKLEFTEVAPDGTIEGPTLKIGRMHGLELLRSIAEALDKQGIKTDKDAKISGILETTREHLRDMRTIVFTRLGVKIPGDKDQ